MWVSRIKDHNKGDGDGQDTSYDWIRIYKLADPAEFGSPTILPYS